MSHRIYTPEFKDEAVRQVVERGYTVKGSRGASGDLRGESVSLAQGGGAEPGCGTE